MTPFVDARKAATMLAALAEPTRLRIAFQLAREPQHVTQLATFLGVPIVNMSHHLGVMRQAGLLDDEKEGRKVHYFFRPGILTPGDGNEILATITIGSFQVVLLTNGALNGNAQPKAKLKPKP